MAHTDCSEDALVYFYKNAGLRGPLLQVNALMLVNVILMVFMVGIGAYGHRYRHIPLIRFLFLASTTLFLPIVSYIVSTTGIDVVQLNSMKYGNTTTTIEGKCTSGFHRSLVLLWTSLVLNIGINTTALVAADAREGRSIHPNMTLLVQAMWTTYLGIYVSILTYYSTNTTVTTLVIGGPFGIILAKLVLKCYAWYIARQSLSFGRNPRIIVGHMKQLKDGSPLGQLASEHMPPSLIVTGEHTLQVQKRPCGYEFWMYNGVRRDMCNKGLVTLDKVWQLSDTLLTSKSLQLKELCFSFALFKLLRCRIARYTSIEVGFIKCCNFLRQILLQDNDGERVFAVIAHEVSFLHDYYYSSLPISYSKSWLPIVSGFISLLSICYCLYLIIFGSDIIISMLHKMTMKYSGGRLTVQSQRGQINCRVYCNDNSDDISNLREGIVISFGRVYYDMIQLYILVGLVMLAEVRDIAFYICSNWIKVALICQYVKHSYWRQSATIQRFVSCVLGSKGRLTRNWEDKMGQSSVLVLHPGKTLTALLRHLINLSGQNKKTPSAVKSAIVGALRKRYNRGHVNGDVPSFQRILHLQDEDKIIWEFVESSTTQIMLVCHIATTILGARSLPHQPPYHTDHMCAANHLSQYCAYLVAHYPELLPEDDEWCKSLYKAVEKDGKRVLTGNDSRESGTSKMEYQRRLIELLRAEGNHEVLRDGARLAERLIGLTEEEETAWNALAMFWSKMILYVAPSDNIDGHMKALARGGELITLLWALVTHLGVGPTDHTTTGGATVDV